MGLRRIHTDKEPALHKVCKTVTSFDWRLRKIECNRRWIVSYRYGTFIKNIIRWQALPR